MATRPDTTLPYVPERSRGTFSSNVVFILWCWFGLGFIAALLGYIELFAPATFALPVYLYIRKRRLAKLPHSILSVEDRRLLIAPHGSKIPLAVRLDDLLEVSLETKTIQRVEENAQVASALRFMNSTVGPKIDTARIELELENESIYLTDHYTSHLDASEWFGKIRRFLRKNGWVPEDERG